MPEMKPLLVGALLLLLPLYLCAQVIPSPRMTDWSAAGQAPTDTSTADWTTVQMLPLLSGYDSTRSIAPVLQQVLDTFSGDGLIVNFPVGTFLIDRSIRVPASTWIKGQGAGQTIFKVDLPAFAHAFHVEGTIDTTRYPLLHKAYTDDTVLTTATPTGWPAAAWLVVLQNDSALVHNNWAIGTVGQIVQARSIQGKTLHLSQALRQDYPLQQAPYLQRITPVERVGFSCFTLVRLDDHFIEQAVNFYFKRAVNCWMQGVESTYCSFSHVELFQSSRVTLRHNYFHRGFGYTSGGRAYGVTLHETTGDCLVENNVFTSLRHAMLVQAGANGNVLAYNYADHSTWDNVPVDASGDIVLHGNYPYRNLIEHNVVNNIIMDASHGQNGPYNTFFRNRANRYGIILVPNSGASQNVVGNEITNKQLPYSLANYIVNDSDHFAFANNNKGTHTPAGTGPLTDTSYYRYPGLPDLSHWPTIGPPLSMNTYRIPAEERARQGAPIQVDCQPVLIDPTTVSPAAGTFTLFPNPAAGVVTLMGLDGTGIITLYSATGAVVMRQRFTGSTLSLSLMDYAAGWYVLEVQDGSRVRREKLLIHP